MPSERRVGLLGDLAQRLSVRLGPGVDVLCRCGGEFERHEAAHRRDHYIERIHERRAVEASDFERADEVIEHRQAERAVAEQWGSYHRREVRVAAQRGAKALS